MEKQSYLKKEILLFTKYGTVGLIGTIVDMGSLYILVEYTPMTLVPAITIAFVLAVINNYLLNKRWTFKNTSSNHSKLFSRFMIISLGGLALTHASMYIQVELMNIWYMYAKFFTSFIVPLWNYYGNKWWTFQYKHS
jgi:putative flippase GtrA